MLPHPLVYGCGCHPYCPLKYEQIYFAYIKIIKNPKHLEILGVKQNSQGRKSNFKMQMFNCAVSFGTRE